MRPTRATPPRRAAGSAEGAPGGPDGRRRDPDAPEGGAGAAALRVPRREDLAGPQLRWLKRGGPTKADLKIVELGEGPLVVKDFRDRAAWVRAIGRLQISRECRAYRWLGSLDGLPRFVGRVDAHALALEHVPGEQLAFAPARREDGARKYAELCAIVERMHASGLCHLDLRCMENVLLGPGGRLYVLDLAGAIWFSPRSRVGRWLRSWLEPADRAALMKWKEILAAGPFTDEEQSFLRRWRFWRGLWIFNPKGRRHP